MIVVQNMKIGIFSFLAILLLTSITITPVSSKLTVKVMGFSSNEGRVFVALYRSTDQFPALNGQYKGKVMEIENKTSIVTFENIPSATYAVAVFHDKNKNGILDKNLVGYPIEKYGFSNNARETFSAPSFKSAAIELEKDKTIAVFIK